MKAMKFLPMVAFAAVLSIGSVGSAQTIDDSPDCGAAKAERNRGNPDSFKASIKGVIRCRAHRKLLGDITEIGYTYSSGHYRKDDMLGMVRTFTKMIAVDYGGDPMETALSFLVAANMGIKSGGANDLVLPAEEIKSLAAKLANDFAPSSHSGPAPDPTTLKALRQFGLVGTHSTDCFKDLSQGGRSSKWKLEGSPTLTMNTAEKVQKSFILKAETEANGDLTVEFQAIPTGERSKSVFTKSGAAYFNVRAWRGDGTLWVDNGTVVEVKRCQ